MTDDELMQAVLLALTRQNVTGSGGGGTPLPLSIGYIRPVFVFEEWVGEMGFMVLTEVT